MPESFPSLASLGVGFESMKISRRSKRSAEPGPDVMRLRGERGGGARGTAMSRRRQQLRRQLLQQQRERERERALGGHREEHRRQGDFGFRQDFWEDVDTDFFDEDSFGQRHQAHQKRGLRNQRRPHHHQQLLRHHQQQEQLFHEPRQRELQRHRQREQQFESLTTGPRNHPNHQQHSQLQQLLHNHPGTSGGGGARPVRRRHRDPYPQQSVQSYPPYSGEFGRNGLLTPEEARDNEILGSGNFEVIKGGTFYDPETYYHTRYNRPQYYDDEEEDGGGDFFENFRDFADIKNDLYRNRNFY